jgi:hypothetical protein
MSSEYDKLYSFLEELIAKNKTDNPVEPLNPVESTESVDFLDISKKRGRPAGSKTKIKQECEACLQKFHTDRFEKHIKNKACALFYTLDEKPPILQKPIHELIIEALDKATFNKKKCRFCNSQIANMKLHLTESHVCNRLAYLEFKKSI